MLTGGTRQPSQLGGAGADKCIMPTSFIACHTHRRSRSRSATRRVCRPRCCATSRLTHSRWRPRWWRCMQTRGGRPKGTWQLCACQDSVCIFRSDHVFESSPASLAPPPPYSIAQTTLLKLLCCEAPRCSSCLAARQQAGHHKNLTPSSSGVLPLNSLRWAHSNKAGRAFFWGL